MSLLSMLRKQMQVVKADTVRQAGGASDFLYDASGQVFACDLQPVDATKRTNFGINGFEASHTLFWNPADVAISETDRVIVDGTQYKLASGKQPSNQRPGWPSEAFVMEARL